MLSTCLRLQHPGPTSLCPTLFGPSEYREQSLARLSSAKNQPSVLMGATFFFKFMWLLWVLVVARRIFSCGVRTLSLNMWDLVPRAGIKPTPTALGVQSLSHWTTRELLGVIFDRPGVQDSELPSRATCLRGRGGLGCPLVLVLCPSVEHCARNAEARKEHKHSLPPGLLPTRGDERRGVGPGALGQLTRQR